MEEAESRRARLRALKEAAEMLNGPEKHQEERDRDGAEDGEPTEEREEEPSGAEGKAVAFRNYIPRDEDLGKQKLPPAEVPKLKEPEPAEAALLETDDPITSIAPRKENWDLRRDVEKRLQKLERRTQRAMIQLMQEEEERRRKEQGGEEGGSEGETDE